MRVRNEPTPMDDVGAPFTTTAHITRHPSRDSKSSDNVRTTYGNAMIAMFHVFVHVCSPTSRYHDIHRYVGRREVLTRWTQRVPGKHHGLHEESRRHIWHTAMHQEV